MILARLSGKSTRSIPFFGFRFPLELGPSTTIRFWFLAEILSQERRRLDGHQQVSACAARRRRLSFPEKSALPDLAQPPTLSSSSPTQHDNPTHERFWIRVDPGVRVSKRAAETVSGSITAYVDAPCPYLPARPWFAILVHPVWA